MSNVCMAPHPKSGSLCIKEEDHVNSSDPRIQQHVAADGLKWPTLHELDPKEGWNDSVLYRM